MRSPIKKFSNFTNAFKTRAHCLRPEQESQISTVFSHAQGLLARGKGLSYSDCCLIHEGTIVDTSRLNHLLSFDSKTGVLIAQGGVSFADLFKIHPHYLPSVIPGTLKATLAGGVANDIHGKNNHQFGSFGQQLVWIDLQIGKQTFHCSPEQNSELFYATIGGLGLTGIIKRLAITLSKASHSVQTEIKKFTELEDLILSMQMAGLAYDYQAAWLDLLSKKNQAILFLANHAESEPLTPKMQYLIPPLPFRCLYSWNLHLFNRFYYALHHSMKQQVLPLIYFNNPLDQVRNWNRLYGKKGLVQFQAVFAKEKAVDLIQQCLHSIRSAKAIPTLSVLKYFTQKGLGLLSFVQPGFTLAIDFVNNAQAETAIRNMNELITFQGGKTYLAKDLFLTPDQFHHQYPNWQSFIKLLNHYKSPMRSDLSKRLGIKS